MKIKQNIWIFSLLIVGVFLLFGSSCKKDEDNNSASNNPTNGQTTAEFNPKVTYGTMTDQDGNVYKTVTIGTQTWMAENLRTTKYNDGTAIPNVTDDVEWRDLSTGAYCNYSYTSNTDAKAYGRLYNWYAVNTGKLAPKGWHVPSDAEWKQLTTYLGGESVAGGKLKETGTTHWNSPNSGATNETGFTALPGGFRYYKGNFFNSNRYGYWWCATDISIDGACILYMDYSVSDVIRDFKSKDEGCSVRCLRD